MYIDVEISNELFKFLVLLAERIHRFLRLPKKLLKVSIIFDFLLFGKCVQSHFTIVVEGSQLLLNQGLDFHQPIFCPLLHIFMYEIHCLEVAECWQPATFHNEKSLVILLFVFDFNHHLHVC